MNITKEYFDAKVKRLEIDSKMLIVFKRFNENNDEVSTYKFLDPMFFNSSKKEQQLFLFVMNIVARKIANETFKNEECSFTKYFGNETKKKSEKEFLDNKIDSICHISFIDDMKEAIRRNEYLFNTFSPFKMFEELYKFTFYPEDVCKALAKEYYNKEEK